MHVRVSLDDLYDALGVELQPSAPSRPLPRRRTSLDGDDLLSSDAPLEDVTQTLRRSSSAVEGAGALLELANDLDSTDEESDSGSDARLVCAEAQGTDG
jgi:hypothetical protein